MKGEHMIMGWVMALFLVCVQANVLQAAAPARTGQPYAGSQCNTDPNIIFCEDFNYSSNFFCSSPVGLNNHRWTNAGTYNATITITASGATNTPQTVPVTLTVTAPVTSSATLTWNANTEPDLAGYRVYVGTAPGVYGAPISVGNVTTYQVTNLTIGLTYYFAIKAVDTSSNESGFSNEVSKTIF